MAQGGPDMAPPPNAAPMMNGGALAAQQRFQHLMMRANMLKQQGHTEESSQELSQIMSYIKIMAKAGNPHQQQQQHPPQQHQQPPPVVQSADKPHANGYIADGLDNGASTSTAPPAAPQTLAVSQGQMTILRAQIQALQYISRNQVVPPHIQQVIYVPSEAERTDHADRARDPGIVAFENATRRSNSPSVTPPPIFGAKEAPSTTVAPVESGIVVPNGNLLEKDTTNPIYPYNAFASAESQLVSAITTKRTHNVLIPNLLPKGLDPYQIAAERQRFIDARIAYRIEELSNLSSTISDETVNKIIITNADDPAHPPMSSAKLRALVELKALKLRDKQRALRSSLVARLQESSALTVDRKVFRRVRKPTLKDARGIESLERRQREDREKRAKQKHLDYLNGICEHGQRLIGSAKEKTTRAQNLGRAILRFHVETEKEEQKRIERISRERLKALKADDEEAYMKLIDTAKDTRITHLLRQTDQYLDSLAHAVGAQQAEASRGRISANIQSIPQTDETTFGAQRMEDDDGAAAAGADSEKKNKVDYYSVAHRVTEKITVQPDLLVGGKLKEYQLKGLQWMVSLYNNHLNGILADEMGLGKTIQTISLVCFLIEVKREPGPFLIIVPLSTLTNWTHEFKKWAPGVSVIVYNGSPALRKALQPSIRVGGFQVLITTFEYIIREKAVLSKIKWLHMIIDEGHRMKNTQSKLSQTLTMFYSTKYRLILTGTPLQNNLPELWSLLNFVLPKIFNSVTSFEEWFNTPFANTGTSDKLELNEEETLLVIRRLHKVLRPFLLRRLKKDVEKELPDKVEKVVKCKMSALQSQLYGQMKKHGMLFDDEGKNGKQGGIKGLNNTIMQFRKICQHPFVFGQIEDRMNPSGKLNDSIIRTSGKVALLDQLLPKLFATGHRVLIFFQMTNIMDIMGDYFNYRGYKHFRLDGSTKPEERTELLVKFNKAETDVNLFMLSTRAGGLGLNLQTADTVIIYDSDWNPHADLQAQDRAHRIGQKKNVLILRFITERSIEEVMLARAKSKLDMDGKVIQAGKFDQRSTAEEQEQFLRSLLEGDQNEDQSESASMEDDEINEMVARTAEELAIFQKMDKERANREEREWRAGGNDSPVPPRLITLEELPEVYQRDEPIKVDEEVEQLISGRGARARATVRYNDGMTDDQWAEALEEGTLDDPPAERKARGRGRPPVISRIESSPEVEEAGGDDDEWGGGSVGPSSSTKKGSKRGAASTGGRRARIASPPVAPKRKRGATSRVPSPSPSLDEDTDEVPEAKRRKTGKGGDTISPQTRERMKKAFQEIYKAVQGCTAEDGRNRCDLFRELPNRKVRLIHPDFQYPDYYTQIQQPIAMSIIRKRSNTSHYKSMAQYAADWRLMFANARQYNQEGSWVYNDANELSKAFEAEFERQTTGSGADLPGADGSGGDVVGTGSATYAQSTPAATPAAKKGKKKQQQQEWSDDDYGSDD
ncbi:hypothetical protein DL93DRAFT_2122689 [Clavulina sp. PMI_390]|nr:hypothetical protein DL93DRAFT_2122689 [Clavulina sp. PMI_390]